jgi:hypothetical protein
LISPLSSWVATTIAPSAPAFSDLAHWCFQGVAQDLDTDLLIVIFGVEPIDRLGSIK